MKEVVLTGEACFEAEGRLLQELGERLVANPDIALVELLKNAYDADAQSCSVRVEDDGATLLVVDDGSGMTPTEFLTRWMKVATAHKMDEPVSPIFGRRRTGQKGIGRFAARFLGSRLVLSTVADAGTKRTELTSTFDWKVIDAATDLRDVRIGYRVVEVASNVPTGTTLRVHDLRHPLEFLTSKRFRTDVLRIVSPLESLDRGRFRRARKGAKVVDPGFHVTLPLDGEAQGLDLGKDVLERAWARLTINLRKGKLEYAVQLRSDDETKTLEMVFEGNIRRGLVADIRYFPRRQGIFSGGGVDGRAAWTWVRENCGIAVVDHGFRMRPFGFRNDDWLHLDLDAAHNERDWSSEIAREKFPISEEVRARPGDNPALNLPSNFQLVGAVFVESDSSGDGSDLTVSMDRQGFLQNEAYADLVEVVRGGIEFLAAVDKQNIAAQEEKRAAEVSARVREDFKAAIAGIRNSPTLSPGDKNRLVAHYSTLSTKLDEVETYGREARKKLETMSLLGVVAGFMTHEAARILDGLERALARLRRLARTDPELSVAIEDVERGYDVFKGHVEYTSLFVDSMHRSVGVPFKARAQVDHVLEKFGSFSRERGLDCRNEVTDDARVSGIPIGAYSGVILNLYTNAIKAVLAREGGAEAPQIVFRGWNDGPSHFIEVLDKGMGVPPELRERIFDPLFTTTSSVSNPLGSGMGLGLSLVREVVQHSGGKLRLVDPPASFSTCFRVQLGASK